MKKFFAQMLSVVGFCALTSTVITVPWYIFGDLPNPLPASFSAESGFLSPVFILFHWMLGLLAYAASACVVYYASAALSQIILVGWKQFIAEEKDKATKAKKNAIHEAGALIAVSVDGGGLFDSSTSLIETTEGFYRVFGKVDRATKGEKIMIRKEPGGVFDVEMLLISGKEYQLTK